MSVEHGRWLRTQAAADYLSVSKSFLDKLRVYGGGPAYSKLGHSVIYERSELDAWALARKVRSTSEPIRIGG